MLSSRSDRTHSGKKLSVAVSYPRGLVIARTVRSLTLKGALLGGLLGFSHAAYMHSSGQRSERGNAALAAVAGETALWALSGAAAGLSGSLAYAVVGGPVGAAVGVAGAALVGSGTFSSVPSIAAMPQKIGEKTQVALGYAPPGEASLYRMTSFDNDIKEDAPPPAPLYHGPWNDRVVFLGMNIGPTRKASHLMGENVDVTAILPGALQDRIRVGTTTYDLRGPRGIAAFVSTLGLAPQAAAGTRKAFAMCEKEARDELAGLARIWARGERGAKIPSRLVLAGHSNGDGVWGDDNGSLRLGPLLELSRALPHATSQIEDAFVTGCYSGGEVTMEQYLLVFPRAKTIWAYEAQAPGVDNGATIDQAGWERATRGRNAAVVPTGSAVAGKKLAVWSFKSGYHATKPPLTLAQLRGKVQWMEENFQRPAMNGQNYTYDGQWRVPISITDPNTGLVRQYYSWLVRLSQRRDLPSDERALWVEKKHQTIRLLYFGATVAPHFQREYGAEIGRGYAKLGLKAPDFGRLNRAQALQEVDKYLAKLDKKPGAAPEAQQIGTLLQRGVQDLDPGIIPDGWV
ncbi:hypothetical protein B1R32_12632 [Abditibacterium utsteinense]|uniref:Uncharacterized protein n=1 Tax=Abditibacterium utsteinense TaxID=1960156 RepID=A0A2S8SPC4_9BACT|nr:hypothetical protein [Abditibacterium utsteinense]PQV62647.1 hypothetical protein B1R32_12632 [Abditibacterium utsteinense]